MGDHVENVNPECKHFGSQGHVGGARAIHAPRKSTADHKPGHEEDEVGFIFAYATTNAGKNWDEGDTLEKTPDQLKQIGAPAGCPLCY